MVLTQARIVEDLRVIAKDSSSGFWQKQAEASVREALGIFFTADWSFNFGEASIATTAPYSTGTLATMINSANVLGTGTAWDTTWPTPAILRASGANAEWYLVSAFVSPTQLTLDRAWVQPSAATQTYTLEFPAYTIPDYVGITKVAVSRWATWNILSLTSNEELLALRTWTPYQFFPKMYAVVPGDGTLASKLWLWPSPSEAQQVRYDYLRSVPDFFYYRAGSASVVNATTAVTGVSTLWAKQGQSLAGMYFDGLSQLNVPAAIASVTNDGALVLSAPGWQGATLTGSPYAISPKLSIPADLQPLLSAIARWCFMQETVPGTPIAQAAEARYRSLLSNALTRYNRAKTRDEFGCLTLDQWNDVEDAALPWQLRYGGP